MNIMQVSFLQHSTHQGAPLTKERAGMCALMLSLAGSEQARPGLGLRQRRGTSEQVDAKGSGAASRKEFLRTVCTKHRTQSVEATLSDTLLPGFPSAGSHMPGIATVNHLSCLSLLVGPETKSGVSLAYCSVNPAVLLTLPTSRGYSDPAGVNTKVLRAQ